jgi:hypothetical protein
MYCTTHLRVPPRQEGLTRLPFCKVQFVAFCLQGIIEERSHRTALDYPGFRGKSFRPSKKSIDALRVPGGSAKQRQHRKR